jgi:hypothetical protein
MTLLITFGLAPRIARQTSSEGKTQNALRRLKDKFYVTLKRKQPVRLLV